MKKVVLLTQKTAQKPKKDLNQSPKVAKALCSFLDDTYAVYFVTHNMHFNVVGPNFYGLHVMLQKQYEELFGAIDILGERVRAIGSFVPLTDTKKLDKVFSQVKLYSESSEKNGASDHLISLINLHRMCIQNAQELKKICEDAHDDETVDIIVEQITWHEKTIWMLDAVNS